MVLMLSNEDVEQVLTMPDTLTVLEELYRDLGRGSAVYRARTDLHTPTSADVGPDIPAAHYLKSMDGAVPRLQAAAIRLTSDVVAFPSVNGLRRREKIPAAPGNRWLGLVLLFSTRAREQNYTSRDFAVIEEHYGFEIRDHQYPRDLDWNNYPDLGELVTGQVPGRSSPAQRTLFLNSIGVGAQFAAVGHHVYCLARERGLGQELPIDWFVESVHP